MPNPFEEQIPDHVLEEITFTWLNDALAEHVDVVEGVSWLYKAEGVERIRTFGTTAVAMTERSFTVSEEVLTVVTTPVVPDALPRELVQAENVSYVDTVLAMLAKHGLTIRAAGYMLTHRYMVNPVVDVTQTAEQIASFRRLLAADDPLELTNIGRKGHPVSLLLTGEDELLQRRVVLQTQTLLHDMQVFDEELVAFDE